MQIMRRHHRRIRSVLVIVSAAWISAAGALLWAEQSTTPPYLKDRGPGIPTSLFGTYIEKHQLLVYPFYEWTKTTADEYKPEELGFTGSKDYLGKTIEQEYLLFISYAFTDRISAEFEAALYAKTTFDKASDDLSNTPSHLEESGLGDVDMQLRWRWNKESAHRPELFSFVELTPPLQHAKVLIGTQDWEGALGFGAIRGMSWGTLTGRVSMAYDGEDGRFEFGEYAVEYLKRLSPRWRVVGAIEGEQEDVSAIAEVQIFPNPRTMVKLNCGFGLAQKAPDFAPEVGVLFMF